MTTNEIEDTRALLHDVVQLLDTATRNYVEQRSSLQELLKQSEQRIADTNNMVHELITVINSLKDAYIHHLDQAVESRDLVITENTEIMRRMEQTEESLRQERQRYDALMQQLMDCMMKRSTPGTSVNIKQ